MSIECVATKNISLPIFLEDYREAVDVGLYQLVTGARPNQLDETDSQVKKCRIKLSAKGEAWLNELLTEGEYKNQTTAIRDALLLIKQRPAWQASTKI